MKSCPTSCKPSLYCHSTVISGMPLLAITHPLVVCFVMMKWKRLALLSSIDFFLNLLFYCCLFGIIYSKAAFAMALSVLTIYLITRAVIQNSFCSRDYRKSVDNSIQVVRTVVVVIIVIFVMLDRFSGIVLIILDLSLSREFWNFLFYYKKILVNITKRFLGHAVIT